MEREAQEVREEVLSVLQEARDQVKRLRGLLQSHLPSLTDEERQHMARPPNAFREHLDDFRALADAAPELAVAAGFDIEDFNHHLEVARQLDALHRELEFFQDRVKGARLFSWSRAYRMALDLYPFARQKGRRNGAIRLLIQPLERAFRLRRKKKTSEPPEPTGEGTGGE